MIQVRISSDAIDDLNDGFRFYEAQERGLGDYFLSQLLADIDGLKITAGIHRQPHRHLHRLLSRRFPYAIMSAWGSTKARRVLKALLRMAWSIKRETGGSHGILERDGWPDFAFPFHDGTEIGPRMLARIAKHTGLSPSDL